MIWVVVGIWGRSGRRSPWIEGVDTTMGTDPSCSGQRMEIRMMVPVFGREIRLRPVGVFEWAEWPWTGTDDDKSADSRGGRPSGRGRVGVAGMHVFGGIGKVGKRLTCLCEGVCDRLWEGDRVVSGDGRPIGERHVEIGDIFSPGGATATRPAIIALGGFILRGEGMPPSELSSSSVEKMKLLAIAGHGLNTGTQTLQ